MLGALLALVIVGMAPSKLVANDAISLFELIDQKTAPIDSIPVSHHHQCPASHTHCTHFVRSNAAQSRSRRLKALFAEQPVSPNHFGPGEYFRAFSIDINPAHLSSVLFQAGAPFKTIYALTMRMHT
jgi:hypothetical protein